jgi:iron(III) transport system ATP-binding protein
MTVFENVAFPLRVARDRRYTRDEIATKVRRALEMVRLGGFESRSATQLSGGQQQRLALARGLVREPALLLLDEPLSNLDAKLREQMRFELKRLQLELGLTTLYVTHDQSEALALSDQIAVFSSGRAIQLGGPVDIYRHPASRFVADFIGTTNFLPGKAGTVGDAGTGQAQTEFGPIACRFAKGISAGDAVLVLVRPEDTVLASVANGSTDGLAGKVENRVYLGEVIDYLIRVGDEELRVRTRPEDDFAIGEPVRVILPAERCFGLPEGTVAR